MSAKSETVSVTIDIPAEEHARWKARCRKDRVTLEEWLLELARATESGSHGPMLI